ncbi:hypothetical protein BJV74DRAFT_867883 [Russula compacta]|nr:hypothetical protein BJV74DRAFT_867883 [Russula compacta]
MFTIFPSQLRRGPRLGVLVLVDLAPRPPAAALDQLGRYPHAFAVAGTVREVFGVPTCSSGRILWYEPWRGRTALHMSSVPRLWMYRKGH